MPEAKTFQTFHETAAIIFHTGREPDELIPVYGENQRESRVLFRYLDVSGLPIDDLEARQLDVEPYGFMEILFKLKRQAFDKIDEYFKAKESTDEPDAKDETA